MGIWTSEKANKWAPEEDDHVTVLGKEKQTVTVTHSSAGPWNGQQKADTVWTFIKYLKKSYEEGLVQVLALSSCYLLFVRKYTTLIHWIAFPQVALSSQKNLAGVMCSHTEFILIQDYFKISGLQYHWI